MPGFCCFFVYKLLARKSSGISKAQSKPFEGFPLFFCGRMKIAGYQPTKVGGLSLTIFRIPERVQYPAI
jgi:hypothetical protein